MKPRGYKIVLAASDSESSEYLKSTWRQMLLACLPVRFAKYLSDVSPEIEVAPDGQAKYVPHGLRIIESLLLQKFSPNDVKVCYTGQLDLFVGEDTRVVGIHAHNPLGITFATGVYAQMYGADVEPVNAAEFRRLICHPVLRKHKHHLKILVGGPGAWQIEKRNLQDDWLIDCLVDGEAEGVALPLFEAAVRGEPIPRKVVGRSPKVEDIPRIHHRSTLGVVEITRGCGRGCDFCSIALRRGKSLPINQILANVRTQVAEGADFIMLTTEDLFLYEQGPRFETNIPALKRLFESVATVPGVRYIMQSHATMAPIVANPSVIEELTPIAVGRSYSKHPASTHPEQRYANLFIGLETGSVRLIKQHMKGKGYPFRPEQWPDVILKGMEILNKHNWFPMCTWILGLPGETTQDTKESLDLLYSLRGAKWSAIPTLFVPLDDTRAEKRGGKSAKLVELTELQWEFFYTCWRYNLDFFHKSRSVHFSYNIGIPVYYYLLGRRLFGYKMKYPAMRLAHFPEWFLRRRLYLDLSSNHPPRYLAAQHVEVPHYDMRPMIPETERADLMEG